MESPVTWALLLALVNLAVNSVTLLLVLAHNLRLSRYLDMREYLDGEQRLQRDR